MDIHFRFEDGNQAGRRNLQADFKLLVYDFLNALFRRFFNYAAHLGAEDMPLVTGAGQQLVQTGNGFHQLHAAFQVHKSLVDFQNRDDALYVPQVICRKFVVDLAVHGIFK